MREVFAHSPAKTSMSYHDKTHGENEKFSNVYTRYNTYSYVRLLLQRYKKIPNDSSASSDLILNSGGYRV